MRQRCHNGRGLLWAITLKRAWCHFDWVVKRSPKFSVVHLLHSHSKTSEEIYWAVNLMSTQVSVSTISTFSFDSAGLLMDIFAQINWLSLDKGSHNYNTLTASSLSSIPFSYGSAASLGWTAQCVGWRTRIGDHAAKGTAITNLRSQILRLFKLIAF